MGPETTIHTVTNRRKCCDLTEDRGIQTAASSVKPIDSHARFIIVGVIVVGSFIALLNQTVMSPALPALMRDFNITTGTVQWVTSVYMLVSGIMVPISGYLIDKFSTRKLFAGALATFMVGTLLCAVAPNFVLLLVGRILQSAGSGVLLPLVAVVPMLVYPPDKRSTPWAWPVSSWPLARLSARLSVVW